MSLDLVTVVMVSGFVIVALAMLFVVLAARYDRVVSTAGPRITRDELEAQIEIKRQALADIDNQIKERTQQMENIAGLQAEVDALCRQRDELLEEHAALAERREEIRKMDAETEEVLARFATAKRELEEKEEALEQVRAQLERAQTLVGEVEKLQAEKDELSATVDGLRAELGDLRQLQREEADLRASVEELRRENARLEGATAAASDQLGKMKAEVESLRETLAEMQRTLAERLARSEAALSEVRRLEEERSTLEARIAHLRAEAERLGGTGDGAIEDPLKELKSMPPVLRQLKALDERGLETEEEALSRVDSHMQAHGLEYPRRTIRAFHTAMKANETTQLAVLAGISGTGKSQLPRRYAEGMGIGFLQVPVQPRWDSPQDLMGFYNYIEGRFRPTDLARAMYQLDSCNRDDGDAELYDRMMLVLLDEMNLARVEYYFSDFLSRLESRPGRERIGDEAARKDAEIELEIRMPPGERPPRIFPGYNILFAGTMNEDESTQSLSDKVVDRANVLRFSAPRTIKADNSEGATPERKALSFARWNGWVRDISALGDERARVEEKLGKLVDIMRDLQRPIGHRLGGAVMSYVANYPENNERRLIEEPLADQVEMRLLPKLRGIEMDQAESHLDELARFVESDLGDGELAGAIRDSAERSREETGQFAWRGVTRQ